MKLFWLSSLKAGFRARRRPSLTRFWAVGFLGWTFRALAVEVPVDPAPVLSQPALRSFLTNYCVACHGPEKKRGDLDVHPFLEDPALGRNREVWDKIRAALESREMPPEERRQPTEAERQTVIRWIDGEGARLDATLPPTPGAVTLRRLNRNEYRNTIRDLFGVDYDAHAEFPHDESGYGFDNIGDVLSLPPMLFEKYLAAAESIAGMVIQTEDPARKRIQKLKASQFSTQADAISTVEEEVWGFFREGEIATEFVFAKAGEYRLRLEAYGDQAGSELPKMAVALDGQRLHTQSVRAQAGSPEAFEVPIRVEAGSHKLSVSYLNNFNADGDRNVYLVSFEVLGPLGVAPEEYPEPHRRWLPRRPEKGSELAYASEVLRLMASRAYRRPATDAEVARLSRLVEGAMKDGESFERGMQWAVQAILLSPHFLYRWELDPAPLPDGGIRELNDYEIASRLSYFLWSSMPDERLTELAAAGVLRRPETLEAEVRRLLRDPKAKALVKNFGGQWLQVRNLDEVEPDPTVFPGWNAALRDAMKQETEGFLWEIIQGDHRIMELLAADFTFLNERLAKHYGIEGVVGEEFRRVTLAPETRRGGILTMGSVLTVTSVPTRTAPVIRGKWILEQILGTPPPPPPPNVPPIEEGAEASKSATLRQRLELHRSKPDCMGCHQKMDPLGFALENFDGIGAWRDKDGPHPVDTSAELPGGRKFQGADGLKEVLQRNQDFPRALTSKMLTYALGRGLEGYDRRVVNGIVEKVAKKDFKFSALVLEVVLSDPFLKRQPKIDVHEQHAQIDR
ncbi:MAG: DUF1592 domain-containing protein [Verrucomicrobiales bacterium]|nr:DUF1592 domain-containing protein [Verrucomicrobiales bacterium]